MNIKIRKIRLLIILVLLVTTLGCQKKEVSKNKEEPEVVPVRVAKIEVRDIYDALDYAANIKAQEEAVVYPKVGGKIIEKVKEAGALVAKSDVIVYIDRDEVGLKFEKAPVESPLSGVVAEVYVDIGANVSAQTQVALILDMEKVKVDFKVPEVYLPRISLGQAAVIKVDAYPQDEFTGKVNRISPLVDLATRTSSIEIVIDNQSHKLKSGMFARVKLNIEEHKNTVVILKEAIIGKNHEVYVYTVQDNKAVMRKITLGMRQDEYIQVLDGLKEGELVVIAGKEKLKDGALVQIEINILQRQKNVKCQISNDKRQITNDK